MTWLACTFNCKGPDRCCNEGECRARREAADEGAKVGARIGAKLARAVTKILDDAGVKRPKTRSARVSIQESK